MPDAAGIAGPINAALVDARTEFAAVLDDDDTWNPEFLAKLRAPFLVDATLGLVYCDAAHPVEDGSGRVMGHPPHPPLVGTFAAAQARGNWFGWSQALWRRDLLCAGLAPEATGCADRDAWLRIAMVAGVYHVAEPLACHFWHQGNASTDHGFMRPGHTWVESQIRAGRYRPAGAVGAEKPRIPLGVKQVKG